MEPTRPTIIDPDPGPDPDPAGPGQPDRRSWGMSRPGAVLGWPRRRWIAAAVLLPAMTLVFGWAGGAWTPDIAHPLWTWPVAVGSGLLGSVIVASYLPAPGSGRLIEVGCSPCAVFAAAAVVISVVLRSGAPASGPRAALCVVLLAAGLRQRLADSTQCPTGAGRAGR